MSEAAANSKEKNEKNENFNDTYFVENKIFCLPLHDNISEKDIHKISSIINSFV